MISITHAVRAIVPALGALAVLVAPIEMEGHARSALTIAVAMVLCWVTEVLHPALVAFIGCFLFRATGDVEFDTAFAGFATATPWFLYGTLLLASAADRSGLLSWLGARTPRVFVTSLMAGSMALLAMSYALAFVLPSSLARATLVSVLALAWSRQVPNRSGAPMAWLVLVAAYSAAMFGHADIPGGPAAIVGWDVAAAAALLVGVFWLSSIEPRPPSRPEDGGPLRRDLAGARYENGTRAEAGNSGTPELGNPGTQEPETLEPRLALLVAIAAGLWMTTPLHGISPALVGLGTGLVCRLPGFAPASGKPAIEPDPLAIIVAGAAISIPAVLVETNASDALWHLWVNGFQGGGLLPGNLVAYWGTTAYRLFSPDGAEPSLPSLVGPNGLLQSSAVWAYAGGTLLALHQSPALVFGMSVGGIRAWQILVMGLLVLAAGSFIVVLF